jgi:PAS domain S-box-containing protein
MEISVAVETDTSIQPQNQMTRHRIKLQELAALVLDESGAICDCNKSVEQLFGYRRSDLVLQHVSTLLPQLSGFALMRDGQIDPHLDFLCHCGHLFQAKNRHGEVFSIELSLVQLEQDGKRILRLLVCPASSALEGIQEQGNDFS